MAKARASRQRPPPTRATSAKKGPAGGPAKKGAHGPEEPARHGHPELPPPGALLAQKVALTAVRTIYAAITRDENILRMMKKGAKDSAAFHALRNRADPKPEVVHWVRENFWDQDGLVMRAVQAQLEESIWHTMPDPDKDRPEDQITLTPRHLRPEKPEHIYKPPSGPSARPGAGPRGAQRKDASPDGGPEPAQTTVTCCAPWCGTP